jgi:hypothetical protein
VTIYFDKTCNAAETGAEVSASYNQNQSTVSVHMERMFQSCTLTPVYYKCFICSLVWFYLLQLFFFIIWLD